MTLAGDDYQLRMPLGQFGVDGRHLDGGRGHCGQGDGTGVARMLELVCCDHVGDNIGCWTIGIGEVTVVIEEAVDE